MEGIRFRKVKVDQLKEAFPNIIFVFTFLLHGGLYQVIFSWRFFLAHVASLPASSYFYLLLFDASW